MTSETKSHSGYVQEASRKAQAYLAEILKENERLRMVVARKDQELQDKAEACERAQSVEQECQHLRGAVTQLEDQLRALKKQNLDALSEVAQARGKLARLERRMGQVEVENREFQEQYGQIERQNTDLMNLYVTSYRIHGTLNRREVLDAIQETIINLVGSEEFAIWELEPGGKVLELAARFGVEEQGLRRIAMGEGLIGEAVARGETYVAGPEGGPSGLPDGRQLLAIVPLKLGQDVSGAIALFSLLPQKGDHFEEVDLELFDLLATHAATALYCSRLHQRLSDDR